jgi:hypothetical protein
LVGSGTYLEVPDPKSPSPGPDPGPLHSEKLYLVDPDPLRTEIQGPESVSGSVLKVVYRSGPVCKLALKPYLQFV